MHKLQSIHPNQNQKQITHESNKLRMLQTEKTNKQTKKQEKNTRSVKKNKSNFINVIEDKFSTSIRRGKLTISFYKKLFSCIKYLQLLKQVIK